MANSPRLQQLQALLADEPGDPFLRYGVAMEHLSLGDADLAMTSFRELTAETPNYVPTYLMLAQTLAKLGREGEAVDVLRRGIAVATQENDQHAAGEMQGLLDSLE